MKNDKELSRITIFVMLNAVLAFLFKIDLALSTVGTNDIFSWSLFREISYKSGGLVLYKIDPDFIHPPFICHFLSFLYSISQRTMEFGIYFPFWFRFITSLADLTTLLILWKAFGPRVDRRFTGGTFAMLSMAPVSILISGYHGNTDPIMIFFVVLALLFLEKGNKVVFAGIALGMSMNIKIVPVILLPVFLLYLGGNKDRLLFLVSLCLTWILGSSPYIFQDPVFILERIFGYSSRMGNWGISQLISWLPNSLSWLKYFYIIWAKCWLMLFILLVSVKMSLSSPKPSLFLQVGIIFFVFMSFTPGFALQYLAWLVPFTILLSSRGQFLFHLSSGMFLFLVYHFWSRGFWVIADSVEMGMWGGRIIFFEMLCWLSVVVLLFELIKMSKSFKILSV